MAIATVKINRPIVARIIRGVNKVTAETTGLARTVERAVAIPKGLYTMTRKCGQNILHIQSAQTYEKYNAFVDDYKMLQEFGAVEVVKIHR